MWMMLPFILNSLLNFVVILLVARFLGPEEYGRLGVALSLATVLQWLLFEWLRLAATRFYSQHDREGRPEVRATLDTVFACIAMFALAAALLVWSFGFATALSPQLTALAICSATANALFDYATALLRARFLDKDYGAVVIAKNVLSFALTVGGAFVFHSAPVVLAGMMISIAGSLVAGRRELIDPGATPARADLSLAWRFFAYGAPIVVASFLYQTVPLANRLIVSNTLGFAEAGQLSLAYEIGVRIVGAIGTALDVVLFQLAVRAEKTAGAGSARAQVARNMGVVFAIVMPAIAGVLIILPSFELLLVPQNYRGPFAEYFRLTAPTLVAFALMNYAVNPAYQITQRLAPLIIAALVASIANSLAVLFLPETGDAAKFAIAHSISSCAGLGALTLMLFLLEPMWPRARDIFGTLAACAVMALASCPLRGLPPGAATMILQIAVGALAYGAAAWTFNVANLRSVIVPKVLARVKR